MRGKNANGDRLVTLFLVNAQEKPEENTDSAWIFQPELIVRAADGTADRAVFRRRLAAPANFDDPERDTLEMIYRKHVEFAVGHGVAVHAEAAAGERGRAVEVRTVVMPQYEVPDDGNAGFSSRGPAGDARDGREGLSRHAGTSGNGEAAGSSRPCRS